MPLPPCSAATSGQGRSGLIVLRHVEPELHPVHRRQRASPRSSLRVRRSQQKLLQSLIRTQRWIEKELVHRRQDAGQRIKRFEPLRQQAQGAVGRAHIAATIAKRSTKTGEGLQGPPRSSASSAPAIPNRVSGHAGCPAVADLRASSGAPMLAMRLLDVGRMQMARDECEQLEGAQ